jgi:hypothetical protein
MATEATINTHGTAVGYVRIDPARDSYERRAGCMEAFDNSSNGANGSGLNIDAMLEELSKELNIDAMLEELSGAVKKLPRHRQGQLFDELEGRA